MQNTIVGVYDSYTQAQNARNELISAGFAADQVALDPHSGQAEQIERTESQPQGSAIGNFFRSLFGMEEHREHGDVYAEAVRRGSCVLAVDADTDDMRDRATQIMNRYDPVDIEERSAHWRSQGWAGYDESTPRLSGDEIARERSAYAQGRTAQNLQQDDTAKIPVVEEELRVGKREVQRGGVRVFQRLKETPVRESVQLRDEHVKVERHPVDQPASEADTAALKEGAIEVRETAEEPVVSKSARVVEEVEIGKEVGQRTQTVDDTVRRTDVEVEQLGASGTGRQTDFGDTVAASDDADYRTHWQNAYGRSGGRYEDYDAAYRYGSTMAGSGRFKNYQWTDAEPQLRSDWEASHPESTWDKVKDAVRYGAERGSRRH